MLNFRRLTAVKHRTVIYLGSPNVPLSLHSTCHCSQERGGLALASKFLTQCCGAMGVCNDGSVAVIYPLAFIEGNTVG